MTRLAEHTTLVNPELRRRLHEVGRRIGNTPLHAVHGVFAHKTVQIFAKKEWEQLSGSVKARAAFNIIRAAVEHGDLHPGKILLDATSGNTGIAYAAIAREIGLRVALCLPENASEERKQILTSLGAEIIYTSKFEGTDGAQEVARDLAKQRPDLYFYADQYKNDYNWLAHYHHTAPEIITALPGITHFVAGLGTTGTFVGTSRRLKAVNPAIQVISLQPDWAMHGLEGWKHLETAVVPAIYDPTLADQNLEIDTAEAYEMIKAARTHEGLLLSPSSAANLVGAIKVAEKLESGIVVTVLPDNAEKYGEVMKRIFG
jgi:cysteine synthase B